MKAKGKIILMATCLLLVSVGVGATDYKSWLPLIPETLGDLAKSGDPDGINMEMSGQSWSSLQQNYTDNSNKRASLTIVSGVIAPQAQAFQAMSHLQMETQDQIIKTVNVSGYKAVFQLNKANKNGGLMISLGEQTLVVIEGEPITSEKELTALAKEVPLKEIATQAK
jgi:hypothetical protein